MAISDPPYVIVVGGTSLSTGRLSGAWPAKLQRALNALCKRRVRVIDAGKGSQTSDWGVTQIPWWKLFKADAAIIEFSINDSASALFAGGTAGHTANMNNIIDSLRENNPGIDITIQTMSPLGPNGASSRPSLASFYQLDRDIANAKATRLLDNNPAWLTYIGQITGTTPSTQFAFPNDNTWTQSNDELHPMEGRVDELLLPRLISHFRQIINQELVVEASQAPTAYLGTSYSFQPTVFGNPTGVTWELISGELPPGVNLNTATGAITGAPTNKANYSFTLRATKGALSGDGTWTIIVSDVIIPTFRSSSRGTATAVTKPSGAAVGDIVFVLGTYDAAATLATPGGAAWQTHTATWAASFGYTSRIWWKVLDATDIANPWNFSSSCAYECVAYQSNGANRVTLKQHMDTASGVNSFTWNSFVKSATHAGLVCVVDDREESNAAATISGGGAAWTQRISYNSATYFWVKFFDLLQGYNGTGPTLNSLGTGYGQVGWLFEFDRV